MTALKEYERFLGEVRLAFPQERYAAVEHGRIPSIESVFDPWRSQYELWVDFREAYLSKRPELFSSRLVMGTRARVYRAWPSLVRDYHLYLYLQDVYRTVVCGREIDECWGIDHLVIVRHLAFGIHAYVDTERARGFRARKERRHSEYADCVIHVDLPLQLATARRLGDLKVYGPADIEPLRRAIREN